MRSAARPFAALGLLAFLATGCGSRTDPALGARATTASQRVAALQAAPGATGVAAVEASEGDAPTRPVAATSFAPVQVPDQVEVHRPNLLVRTSGLAFDRVAELAELDGVVHVAAGSLLPVDVPGPDDTVHTFQALAIDPSAFRSLTPEVTAQTVGVWERMAEGDVVVRHDVANQLGLELGSTMLLEGPGGRRVVRIGAFASNGAPPLADLLVPLEVGGALGADHANLLVVASAEDEDAREVGEALLTAVGGGEIEVRQAPRQEQARLVGSGPVRVEPFRYTDLGDGMIVIDPNWVRKWIVTVDLPRVGPARVHRVMAPQLLAAMREVEEAGLLGHLDPAQFGGAWVPRHIDWDPKKPLSMHAWGLAIDFNTRDNWLGQTPRMDRRIVEIFERWGFAWGGWWKRPDGMHFELARIVRVEG